MKLRILLTGRSGQIGGELATMLPRLGDVAAFDRHELDLANPVLVRKAIQGVHPNIIVNAAAYTAVDQAEKEESRARILNVDAPALMAEEAKKIGATLVHYSTDYVFDGSTDHPYTETDQPNPLNVYGKTKLAGEEAMRAVGVPYLIFRTSWVYGMRGRNFLLTMLRLATEREELRLVRDQIGAPTWSREIAKGTAAALLQLSQKGSDEMSKFSGIYHMTAAGRTSWFEFAEAILDHASRTPPSASWFTAATGGRPLLVRRVNPIATAEYKTPARRPAFSVLSNDRLKEAFGLELPDWNTQLTSVFTGA